MRSGPEGIGGRSGRAKSGLGVVFSQVCFDGWGGGGEESEEGELAGGTQVALCLGPFKHGREGGEEGMAVAGSVAQSVERAAEHERLQVGQGKTGGDGGLGKRAREVKPAAGRAEMRSRA